MDYCTYCKNLPADHVHVRYHDLKYGYPIRDDDGLFGRLMLEQFQAGLSWEIILKKEQNFKEAFDDFSIARIANYDEEKVAELLENKGIIRNKLKINSVIHNAKVVLNLIGEYGSFAEWIELQVKKGEPETTKAFKKSFKFVGGEILNEFLMSTGYRKGAHRADCEVFRLIEMQQPAWLLLQQ